MRSVTIALVLVWVVAVPVGATGTDIAPELDDGVHIEGELSSIATQDIEDAVKTARAEGVELSVVVLLEEEGDAEEVAGEILAELGGGTVLVLTETEFGLASDEFSDERLDDLIADSPALGSLDTDAGVEQFVDAATDEGIPWGLLIGIAIAIGVALAIVGRGWRVWSTRTRRRDAAETHKAKLKTRVDRVSDQILELSVPIQLAENPELTGRFASVTERYQEVSRTLEGEVEAFQLDSLEVTLDEVEGDLDRMAREVGDPEEV